MTPSTAVTQLLKLKANEVQRLAPTAQHPLTWHQWSQSELDALSLALAARRPLLVRGEPGTGKTQLARAAAQQLGWALHAATVTPGMEPQDLVYRFDAIQRLADAHAAQRKDDALDEHRYYEPGPLWKAFGWTEALPYGALRKLSNDEKTEPAGHVVLIDEIDKAESDLPNSLLEVLGQRSFSIPALNLHFGHGSEPMPLVLITTNEERELPAAFVRRCMVLNLEPDATLSYEAWLVQRGMAHFGPRPERAAVFDEAAVLRPAAQRLAKDRQAAADAGYPKPGLAEYLDLLYALQELTQHLQGPAREAEAQRLMRALSAYAYLKHPATPGTPMLAQGRACDDAQGG